MRIRDSFVVGAAGAAPTSGTRWSPLNRSSADSSYDRESVSVTGHERVVQARCTANDDANRMVGFQGIPDYVRVLKKCNGSPAAGWRRTRTGGKGTETRGRVTANDDSRNIEAGLFSGGRSVIGEPVDCGGNSVPGNC